MKRAILAGLVAASSVLATAAPVFAGEGSALRGLRPPRDVLGAASAASIARGIDQGLRWHAADVDALLPPRLTLYGGTFQTLRFSSSNTNVGGGVYRSLIPQARLGPDSSSRVLDVFPRYSASSHITQHLARGWGLGIGVRQTEYGFATTNLLSVSAERYFGSFRGAYTLYSNRVEGSDQGSAQRFQLNYFYGDRNTVGLAYTTGRDIDNPALSPTLQLSDARDLALSGRHWISTNWALTYDLSTHEQANLYRRQGLRLGVSRSF